MDGLDLVPRNLKLHRFSGVDISLLNQSVTCHHNEQLPLGVVPVLPLGDSRTADVDAHLPAVGGMHQFRERAAVVHVHLQGILELVRRQIGQVQGIQLLSKGTVWHLGHYLHIKKPYCVVEGIASKTQQIERKENSEKTILYTGTLHQKFGVMNLVNAFSQIEDPDYRLVICGIGDSEQAIKDAVKDDSRITFLGQLPRNEVIEWQKKATVLVNPRQNNEEFTKYSFPSKTMEYLSSGIPVVAYKLDGIPDEYDQYIQYVADDSIESLKKKLVEVCEMTREERQELGNIGRNFVLMKKNSTIQVRKIRTLVNEVL